MYLLFVGRNRQLKKALRFMQRDRRKHLTANMPLATFCQAITK